MSEYQEEFLTDLEILVADLPKLKEEAFARITTVTCSDAYIAAMQALAHEQGASVVWRHLRATNSGRVRPMIVLLFQSDADAIAGKLRWS